MPAPLSYVPFLSGQQNSDLMAAQQQQAMAQALLAQGVEPVSTNNRMMGNIAYRISPFEGMAKMGDILSGKIQQNEANDKMAAALGGIGSQMGGSGDSGTAADSAISRMPPDVQRLVAQWSMPEAYGGNPRAAAELISKFSGPTDIQKNYGAQMPQYINNELGAGAMAANPGASAMQTGLGQAAAQMAPPGTMPQGAGGMPQIQPPPYGGMPASQTPVQGPQPLPPIGQQGNAAPLPQQKPILPPPSGANPAMQQLANAGPVSGTQGIPQINASSLQAPQNAIPPQMPPQAMPAASGPGTPPPSPHNYPTIGSYNAAMEAWKAGQTAQAQVGPAGAKTEAEDTGKNLADAQKTFNVAMGNLPRAMQRFEQLRQVAPDASYGAGVSEEEPNSISHDFTRVFARTAPGQYMEPKTATANQVIDQATNQGVLSELGPQLAGLRGNKFLESIASGASGLNPADPPAAKINAVNGLQDQYIANVKSLAAQRRSYGDPNVPSDEQIDKMVARYKPAAPVEHIQPAKSSFTEGQTATNPQTGQKLTFKNGQWQ